MSCLLRAMQLYAEANPRRLTSLKECNRVLANYESKIVKCEKDLYYISLDCEEYYFTSRKEILEWCRFTFWNRQMEPIGGW